MIFAQNVAKLQRETGYNQTQLAQYLGVSRKTVSRILSRRRVSNLHYVPSYRTVRTVAEKVGLSSDDVFQYRIEFEQV